MKRYVAVSGGFDPIHEGHIRYLKGAWEIAQKENCKVLVILNQDEWLRKKGYGHPFYTYEQRKEILEAIKYVDVVVSAIDNDHTVACTLAVYRPKIFAKGGDRDYEHIPDAEKDVCKKYGIKIITGVGGYDKPNSSRYIITKVRHKRGNKFA